MADHGSYNMHLGFIWLQIHQRDLGPALEWVREHRPQLGGGRPSAFEFSLHQLAFLQALQDRGKRARPGSVVGALGLRVGCCPGGRVDA